MNKYTSNLISIIISLLVLLGFYFIEYKPGLKREYQRGLESCTAEIDTFYTKGKDSIIYRDTSFNISKSVPVEKTDSSIYTSFDTTLISHKDSIKVHAKVKLKTDKDILVENIGMDANWFLNIEHKDAELVRIDTVTIYTPKYLETVITENNWMMNFISYVGGVMSAIIIFLFAN